MPIRSRNTVNCLNKTNSQLKISKSGTKLTKHCTLLLTIALKRIKAEKYDVIIIIM